MLWQLAFEAHAEGTTGKGQQLAGIEQWTLQKKLAKLRDNDQNWACDVIDAIKLRAGLLLERELEIFTFPHRTFQEYLAGVHLSIQADFARQATARAAEGSLWREVILLAVGRLVYLAGDTAKPLMLVSELCPRRFGSDETSWRNAWLAGEVLAEIGLKRVQDSATGQDLLERVQQRLVALITGGYLTPRERAAAGEVLAHLGDPRPEVMTVDAMQFCGVPSGSFWLGSGDDDPQAYGDEKPRHQFNIKYGYWLARYPVTVAQWRAFVTGSGHKPTDADSLRDPDNRPVRTVTWPEAVTFCAWLTDRWQAAGLLPANWQVRLPSEAEWEKAARGGLQIPKTPLVESISQIELTGFQNLSALANPQPQRRYPWGNKPDPNRANYDDTKIGTTSAVGCFPGGKTVYGVEEMSGNADEWCATKWQDNYQDYQDDNRLEGRDSRVVRGGAFLNSYRCVRCAYRDWFNPSYGYFNQGFRVVLSPFFPSDL